MGQQTSAPALLGQCFEYQFVVFIQREPKKGINELTYDDGLGIYSITPFADGSL